MRGQGAEREACLQAASKELDLITALRQQPLGGLKGFTAVSEQPSRPKRQEGIRSNKLFQQRGSWQRHFAITQAYLHAIAVMSSDENTFSQQRTEHAQSRHPKSAERAHTRHNCLHASVHTCLHSYITRCTYTPYFSSHVDLQCCALCWPWACRSRHEAN
jgi:hypothetical protein